MKKRVNRGIAKRQLAPPNSVSLPETGARLVDGNIQVDVTSMGLREVGGSKSTDFNYWVLKAVMKTRWEPTWMSDSDRSQQASAIIQALRGLAPMDEAEGMLVSQAVALHIGAMECFRRAAIPEQSFEVGQGLRKQGASLSRAYIDLIAALDRRRGKGVQQIVRVERVQVAAGGQAIVGNVIPGAPLRPATEGVGYVAQSEGEPDAPPAGLANDTAPRTVVPEMRSDDPRAKSVSVASDAERPVPDARGRLDRA